VLFASQKHERWLLNNFRRVMRHNDWFDKYNRLEILYN